MSFFAYPLEEDLINNLVKKNKVFHLIDLPLSKYSTKEFQSTNLAPESIKKSSYEIFGSNFGEIREKYIKEHNQDFFNDYTVSIKNKKEIINKLKNFLKKIEEKNKENIFIFLGGNHLITYFIIHSIKPDIILHFDSHPDVDPLEKELNHSNFIKFLLEEIPSLKIIQIGLSNATKEELNYLKQKNIKFFKSIDFFTNRGKILKEIIKEIKETKNKKNKKISIYLTIDTDVFEGNFASYQGESLGISIRDFLFFIYELNNKIKEMDNIQIKGFDLVELNPHLDINNYWTTSITRVLIELISIF